MITKTSDTGTQMVPVDPAQDAFWGDFDQDARAMRTVPVAEAEARPAA